MAGRLAALHRDAQNAGPGEHGRGTVPTLDSSVSPAFARVRAFLRHHFQNEL